MKRTALLVAAALVWGCGGTDDAPASNAADTGVTDTSAKDATSSVGNIAVTVRYTGGQKGPLAIGAFIEPVPKSTPPVTFDTSKTPTFPYAATLTDLDPGRYWVIAVIDLAPLSGGAVKPGPEDLQATSAQVDVVAGQTKSIEISIGDTPPDAGADGATDASSD